MTVHGKPILLMVSDDDGEVRAQIQAELPAQRVESPPLVGWVRP